MPLSVLTISFSHSCSVLSLSVSGGWAMIGSPFPPLPPRRRTSASIMWTSPVELKNDCSNRGKFNTSSACLLPSNNYKGSPSTPDCAHLLRKDQQVACHREAFLGVVQSLNTLETYKHMKIYFCRYIWPSNHIFSEEEKNEYPMWTGSC